MRSKKTRREMYVRLETKLEANNRAERAISTFLLPEKLSIILLISKKGRRPVPPEPQCFFKYFFQKLKIFCSELIPLLVLILEHQVVRSLREGLCLRRHPFRCI